MTSEKRMDEDKMQATFKSLKEQKVQPLYLIHNAVVPCAENGIYYGKPYLPSYGFKQCRIFAGIVYWRIWGDIFNSYAGTKDDLLRNVKNITDRKITEENTRKFIFTGGVRHNYSNV